MTMRDKADDQCTLVQSDTATWRFLEERGLRLMCMEPDTTRVPDQTHIIFSRNTAWYGVKAHTVRAIMPLEEYMPLPFTQPYILGLVGVDDQMLPVLDMCSLIHNTHTPPNRGASLIIVRLIGMDLCLLADAIVAAPTYSQGSPTTSQGVWQRI